MVPSDDELITSVKAHGLNLDELFLIQGRVYVSKDAGDFRATSTYAPIEASLIAPESSLVSLLRRLAYPEYDSTEQLDDEIKHLKEWELLYAELTTVLARHGKLDPFGDGDFYLIEDCYSSSLSQHKVECASAEVFTPALVVDVQGILKCYSRKWEAIFALPAVGGKDHAYSVYAEVCVEHHE